LSSAGLKPALTKRVKEYLDKHPASSSSSSSSSAEADGEEEVQWQWQGDNGWVDYDDHTSGIIEAAHKKGAKSVNLVHGFFGSSGGYVIDFVQNQQIKSMTGYPRAIRRLTKAESEDDIPDAVWEWQGDTIWQPYDQQTTDILEKAFMAAQVRN
jgi:hypothetical protein